MQKEKLEHLINDFSLENLNDFLYDANFEKDIDDFSFLNSEDIFSDVQKLGEIETEDKKKIIVAAIKVENDLSERSSRKKQYDLGKKILENHRRCEAGIFVFYDKQGSFRFSLIYPTYSGTKRVLNSFKRYTYFVSKEQTNKTFLNQIGDGDFSTLENIKDAFSVEKVTKEFFKEYKNLFEDLVGELDKNHTFKNEAAKYNINTENFAKKLLGQIVFLYFLQKKCWLGATKDKSLKQGDKDFLQNLFDKKYREYNNFFNDILEHLFYGALNKKSDKVGNFYRDYFKCQIPFLNGGLFDPEYDWAESKIYLDDKIFKQILEVFNRYNFTVDENSPMDQEIAIDPEMLGKVFENLLSENLRKGKGTYYTPREIVHYMCQESLINYLISPTTSSSVIPAEAGIQSLAPTQKDITEFIKHNEVGTRHCLVSMMFPETISQNAKLIDEKLASIKVCDPACGSGAFLVGMLQEIIKTRQILQSFIGKKTSEYKLKKETIQNCIYGVDIDPGAIEIAKLRLWLSLVVDYDLEEIEPLPNLDYKIMQGNSLLEELVLGDTSIKLFDQEKNKMQVSLLENEEQSNIDKLNSLHKKYFALNDLEEKKKVKKEIDDIEYEVIKKSVEKEVKKLESDNKKFEFVTMGGMKKKDAESFTKNLSKQAQIMNVLDEFKKTGIKPFFLWRLYFGDVFENGGFDVVIANPPYVNIFNIKDENYRSSLKSKYKVYKNKTDLYAFFAEKGFDLLKKNGKLVYIFSNSWLGTDSFSKFREFLVNETKINKLVKCQTKVFEHATVSVVIIILSKEIVSKNEIELLEFTGREFKKIDFRLSYDFIRKQIAFGFTFDKLLEIKIPFVKLGEIAKFSLGIKTADNKRFISDSKKSNASYKILRGKDIGRYFKKFDNKWIWYKSDLMNQRKGAGPRKLDCFLKTKILIKDIATEIQATLDTENYLTIDTINIIYEVKNYDLKFILAILNSKLINKWFKINFTAGLHVKINQLENIPIPKKVNQKPFIKLVDQILEKKKDNPEADVGELEREIDEMVYELYNLTKEEIKIIENK